MKSGSKEIKPRRGGRPSRRQAEKIKDDILDIAAGLFFAQGYGATSIEAIVNLARISKRTFYHRFKDKAAVFRAVVHRIVERVRPATGMDNLFVGPNCEEILTRIARVMLHAAVTPEALALQGVILAEAVRFPELAAVVLKQGVRAEAVQHIADLLQKETRAGHLQVANATFAADQFIHMVVAGPQRRAMGLGKPLSGPELDAWARDTVKLFLNGCRGS